MKTINAFLFVLLFTVTVNLNYSNSQESDERKLSNNVPLNNEQFESNPDNSFNEKLVILEKEHKELMESGKTEDARLVQKEIYLLIPGSKILQSKADKNEKMVSINHEEQGDWLQSIVSVDFGNIVSDTLYNRKIEMKSGEDKNLYSASVSYWMNGSVLYSQISFSKSTNCGNNWAFIYGAGFPGYISNVSLLVESRNNNNPDSVRLIAFYAISDHRFYQNSVLKYYSVRANGTGTYGGLIASPSAGNKITYLSAVSDGYFYQNATYLGVVCTETDNANTGTQSIRYFRSIDWGATWVSSSLITSYNDCFISADFKRGTSDSVYIAVERKFSAAISHIRILATQWNPVSAFRTIYLTNEASAVYEKPCINIKQNSIVDSIIISSTKNKMPNYHYSHNGGSSWYIDNSLGVAAGSKTRFTFCSSYPESTKPFTICWQNESSDSVNIKSGVLGSFGQTLHKINTTPSSYYINPVCVSFSKSVNVLSGVFYFYANLPSNGMFNFNGEGLKKINVYVIPQGLYLNATTLSFDDSVRVFIRKSTTPYNIIDSSFSFLSKYGFISLHKFTSLPDDSYYLDVRHRNSIRVWSSTPVIFSPAVTMSYDFTQTQESAFGNNQKKVSISPGRFAMFTGDVNQDDVIDGTDGLLIDNDAALYNQGRLLTDLDGDEIIDGSDAAIADNNASDFVTAIIP